MDKPTLFTLPDTIINSILGYLGTRPFQEVAGLIEAVQKNAVKVEGSSENT